MNKLAEDSTTIEEPRSLREELEASMTAEPADVSHGTVVEPVKVEPEAAKGVKSLVDATQTQEENNPATPIPAPTSWRAEAKADWDKLPETVKNEIAKREAEVHKGFTTRDENAHFGKQIKAAIDPYLPLIERMGGDPAQAVKSMLELSSIFNGNDRGKLVDKFNQMVQYYQISPDEMVPAQYEDPRVRQLSERNAQLERNQTYQAESSRMNEVEKFMTDFQLPEDSITDAFIAEVEATSRLNPQHSERQILESAWENYRWKTPELREQLISNQLSERDTANKQAQLDRAKAARFAGGSVAGSPGVTGAPQNQPASSVREELMRFFDT